MKGRIFADVLPYGKAGEGGTIERAYPYTEQQEEEISRRVLGDIVTLLLSQQPKQRYHQEKQ